MLLIQVALFLVFCLDVSLPLGVASGILYILTVASTLRLNNRQLTLLTALVATMLMGLGYWLSPDGITPWKAQLNRGLSLGAVWITAWLVSHSIRRTVALQDLRETLEQRIQERTTDLENRQRATFNLLQDIERARQDLSVKEKQFRLVIEAAPSGMIMVDDQGRIALVNALTCTQFGYAREEILGRPIEQLIPERFRGNHPGQRAAFFSQPEPRAMGRGRDLFGLRKDGTEFPVEIGLNPVTTEQGFFVLASVVDITERKRTEQSIQQLLRQNQLLLNSAGEGIYGLDTQGNITFINPVGANMLGYEPEELIGMPFHDTLHHTKPDGTPYPSEECPIYASFRVNAAHQGKEEFLWRRDGTTFPIQYSSTPIHEENGTLVGAVVTFSDITERKRNEETVLKWTQALERSNRELDDFAYIASHDLKEPLRGIHNYSRFLTEDYATLLGEEGIAQCHTIMRLSQRMEELINTLLYYSRIGRTDLAMRDVDLDRVIHDVVETLKPRLEEEGITIRYPKPLPMLRCDEARVGEIFRNLITNAMKYNDKAEKWIEIGYGVDNAQPGHARHPGSESQERTESTAPTVYPGLGTNKQRLHFYVRDNGIGIPVKHFENIFRIFKRLQGREKFGGGTGAGLTITQKIVHHHGGKIWLDSALGEGTTFWFTLESSQESAIEKFRDVENISLTP